MLWAPLVLPPRNGNVASCSKPLCGLFIIDKAYLKISNHSAGKSTLPKCLCFSSFQLIGSFLGQLPMDGLQSILCFEMASVSLGLWKTTAAGWGDNSQLWQVSLWEFLRELQVAMNSPAFGGDLQRSLPLCPLALTWWRGQAQGPERLGRAWRGGPLGDRLSCVQIPLGWPWGERLLAFFRGHNAPFTSCN